MTAITAERLAEFWRYYEGLPPEKRIRYDFGVADFGRAPVSEPTPGLWADWLIHDPTGEHLAFPRALDPVPIMERMIRADNRKLLGRYCARYERAALAWAAE